MSMPRTLGPYAERFLTTTRHRVKWRTWERYESALRLHIVPAFGPDTPLVNLTRGVLQDFVTERLGAGYAPRTVRVHVKVVSALLSAAVDENLLDANPAFRLARMFAHRDSEPREKAMPRAELERLLAATLRVDADTSVPWIFASAQNPSRPWSRTHIWRTLRRVCAAAKLPPYSAHAFRHTFASLLADEGVSPWALRDLLGHHSVAITERYVRLRARHRDAVELLDDPARA